jgi:hypothetical protein
MFRVGDTIVVPLSEVEPQVPSGRRIDMSGGSCMTRLDPDDSGTDMVMMC